MCDESIWLVFVLAYAVFITYICRGKNAWDVAFFNSTLAIFVLCLFFFNTKDYDIQQSAVISIGAVATAENIIALFIKKKKS